MKLLKYFRWLTWDTVKVVVGPTYLHLLNKIFLWTGQVIKAWDIGVATMKRGELAMLTCKSEYAYGKNGSPPKIPPDSTLYFEVNFIWNITNRILPLFGNNSYLWSYNLKCQCWWLWHMLWNIGKLLDWRYLILKANMNFGLGLPVWLFLS